MENLSHVLKQTDWLAKWNTQNCILTVFFTISSVQKQVSLSRAYGFLESTSVLTSLCIHFLAKFTLIQHPDSGLGLNKVYFTSYLASCWSFFVPSPQQRFILSSSGLQRSGSVAIDCQLCERHSTFFLPRIGKKTLFLCASTRK